jgi:hypothetical protein
MRLSLSLHPFLPPLCMRLSLSLSLYLPLPPSIRPPSPQAWKNDNHCMGSVVKYHKEPTSEEFETVGECDVPQTFCMVITKAPPRTLHVLASVRGTRCICCAFHVLASVRGTHAL